MKSTSRQGFERLLDCRRNVLNFGICPGLHLQAVFGPPQLHRVASRALSHATFGFSVWGVFVCGEYHWIPQDNKYDSPLGF